MNTSRRPNNKKYAAYGLAFLLIALPTLIVALRPESYNALTQVLFDLLLAGASVWIGKLISDDVVVQTATTKWLPAAEMVCNELLTMSATTERLCRKQSFDRQTLHVVFPTTPKETLAPIENFVNVRCGHCSEGLENIKNHIENSYKNWTLFISNNCEEAECEKIQSRLNARRTELFDAVERDFPGNSRQTIDGS